MKNIKKHGILLGAGLLSATTLISFTSPASAQPRQRRDVREAQKDLQEARRDVRRERQDVRQADTKRERQEAKAELRDAKRDLKDEKRDLRREQQQVRPGTTYRPGYNVRPGNVYRPGTVYRPGYNNRPVYGRPGAANAYRTLQGVVTDDTSGDDFNIRTTNGQIVRVFVPSGEPGAISRGDVVRVYGYYSNGAFQAASTTIVRNR